MTANDPHESSIFNHLTENVTQIIVIMSTVLSVIALTHHRQQVGIAQRDDPVTDTSTIFVHLPFPRLTQA